MLMGVNFIVILRFAGVEFLSLKLIVLFFMGFQARAVWRIKFNNVTFLCVIFNKGSSINRTFLSFSPSRIQESATMQSIPII